MGTKKHDLSDIAKKYGYGDLLDDEDDSTSREEDSESDSIFPPQPEECPISQTQNDLFNEKDLALLKTNFDTKEKMLHSMPL